MKNLYKLVDECRDELNAIGIYPPALISFSVNTRATKRWGQCKLSYGVYSINISSRLLEDGLPDMVAKNTIAHELLHTMPDCMNHGNEWQRYANKVNKAYSGYNIKRCTSAEEKGIAPIIGKWNLDCQDCGRHWDYQRKSKIVDACLNHKATCPCGSKKIKVTCTDKTIQILHI